MLNGLKWSILAVLFGSQVLLADQIKEQEAYREQNWGIGAAIRLGSIPYTTEDDAVSSFVPMLFMV